MYPGSMLPVVFGPATSTMAVPLTQTLRCSGVAPIDPLTTADSPTRLTVTVVPPSMVRVIEPSGRGMNVSALAAPAEKKPRATADAAPTPANRAPFLRMWFMSSSRYEFAEREVGGGRTISRC